MNCERFRYWISLKADGRLDAPRLGDLSAHLQACASCRGFEDNLQKNKARRKREPEALGALYSLWASDGQKWLDPSSSRAATR